MTSKYNTLISKKNIKEILEYYKKLRQKNREKKKKTK